jgi:transcriptional regulator NrdR family protein
MQIISQCPFCDYSWLLDDSAADRRIRCEKCHKLFKVPNLADVPKAAKVIKDSKGTVYVDESGRTYG